jgi:hypothetical protein
MDVFNGGLEIPVVEVVEDRVVEENRVLVKIHTT